MYTKNHIHEIEKNVFYSKYYLCLKVVAMTIESYQVNYSILVQIFNKHSSNMGFGVCVLSSNLLLVIFLMLLRLLQMVGEMSLLCGMKNLNYYQ